MPLKTPQQYLESIRREVNLYMFGEKITQFWKHPYYRIIEPSINAAKKTYELAQMDRYRNLMTTESHMTGETINRFNHIHQSVDDLVKKVEMQRLVGQKTACCFQRCVGFDAANALYSITWEIDKKYDSRYHERFRRYWTEVQTQDLFVAGSMTDTKGIEAKGPASRQIQMHIYTSSTQAMMESWCAAPKYTKLVS